MLTSERSSRTRRQTSGPSIFGIIQSRMASVGSVAACRPRPRLLAVVDDDRFVVPAAQRTRENLAGDAIVLRDQNPHVREYSKAVTGRTGPFQRLHTDCGTVPIQLAMGRTDAAQ